MTPAEVAAQMLDAEVAALAGLDRSAYALARAWYEVAGGRACPRPLDLMRRRLQWRHFAAAAQALATAGWTGWEAQYVRVQQEAIVRQGRRPRVWPGELAGPVARLRFAQWRQFSAQQFAGDSARGFKLGESDAAEERMRLDHYRVRSAAERLGWERALTSHVREVTDDYLVAWLMAADEGRSPVYWMATPGQGPGWENAWVMLMERDRLAADRLARLRRWAGAIAEEVARGVGPGAGGGPRAA